MTTVLGLTVSARQGEDIAALRARLQARYDLLTLQDGVALVPRQPDRDIRIIQIRNGSVALNGIELTGAELRSRLGADADLVLRVSYLDAAGLRTLAPSAAPAPPSAPTAPAPPAAPEVIAPPVPPLPDLPEPSTRRVRRGGDMVRIIGNVRVERDERIEGDVVAVLGNAYIDGEVTGEVTVVMGSAYLGPEAVVRDNVTVVGGRLNRSPGAQIEGTVDNIGIGGTVGPEVWSIPALMGGAFLGRIGSFAGTLLRVGLLALLALVVMAFGRATIERIANFTAVDPVRAGLVGFFAQVAFFPVLVITCIVLAVSIIGIPLLLLVPFGIFLMLIVLLVGFTGVAYQVGRYLNARFGWNERGAYGTVLLGVLMIAALTLIARAAAVAGGSFLTFPISAVGFLIEYAAWTLGFGAAILAWMQRRQRQTPPPLPSPSS
jgi:hypothetical protein